MTFLGTAKLFSILALQYWILKWTFLCFKVKLFLIILNLNYYS